MNNTGHWTLRITITALLPFIFSACYSIDTYESSPKRIVFQFSPDGAHIVSRGAPQNVILSDNSVQASEVKKYKNWFFVILPIGKNYAGTELVPPPGLSARWPSGAETPIKEPLYGTSPIIFHPDRVPLSNLGNIRTKSDEYDSLASNNNLIQYYIVSASPSSGIISYDGINFSPGPISLQAPFNFNEFSSSSKAVSVSVKWPSGIAFTTNTFPIKRAISFPKPTDQETVSIVLNHPLPNTTEYAYDMLAKRHVEVIFKTSPYGAELYIGTNILGVTPAAYIYEFSLADYRMTNFQINATAKWNSGVKQQESFVINLHHTEPYHFIIRRPPDSPSSDIDTIYAKEKIWEDQYATNLPIKTLVFASDPEGATIYDGDKRIGPCPALLTWAFTKEDYMAGSMQTPKFTARWPSGATLERYFSLQFDNLTPETQTFIRPSTAPDKDIDVNYAIQLKQIEATKEVHAKKQELERRAIEEQERQARQDELFRTMQASEDRRRESSLVLMQQLNEESRRRSERMDRAIEQDRIQQQRQADERRQQMDMIQNTSRTLMDMIPKTTTGSGYIHTPSGNANYFYRQTEYGH